MPQVSVIIPSYNHARFLEQRLRSVLDQTFQDLEVICLDDASTDDSRAVLDRFASDPRVRLEFNARNSGIPFKQWNKGARLARGEYLWIAESDDFADARLLETLVPVLEANPGVGVAYCQSRRVDAEGREWGTLLDVLEKLDARHWQGAYVNDGRDEVARYLVHQCTIPNASAALVRRSALEKAGWAEEGFRLCGDWMTWVRLLAVSDVAYRPEALNYFRSHGGNVRSASVRNGVGLIEEYRVLDHVRRHFAVTDAVFEDSCWRRAFKWARLAFYDSARLHLSANWRVYRAARQVDRRALGRVLRAAWYLRGQGAAAP